MPDSPSVLADALRDRYRFERELGAGGMARVWLADDLKHERKVAIKILHPELAAVLGTERFLAEMACWNALNRAMLQASRALVRVVRQILATPAANPPDPT